MRWVLAAVVVLGLCVAGGQAQDRKASRVPARFGIEADLNTYPQGTPKETLASVLRGIEARRLAYVLAHLADPEFVDERVRRHGGRFEEFVRETAAKLADNPDTVKELTRFLKEGEWEGDEKTASAQLKDMKDRRVYLKRLGDRWFLENRQK